MRTMTVKSIDEVNSGSTLGPCRIKPLLPMGDGSGPSWQRTDLDFFYRMAIEKTDTGLVLRMCNYDDSLDFPQGDFPWSVEKDKDIFIRCVFPEKVVGKKIRILYFKTQQDRDSLFQLIQRFKVKAQ